MPREKRKPEGSGKAAQEWGIVVRREDGTQLYYFINEGHIDSWGKPLEFRQLPIDGSQARARIGTLAGEPGRARARLARSSRRAYSSLPTIR